MMNDIELPDKYNNAGSNIDNIQYIEVIDSNSETQDSIETASFSFIYNYLKKIKEKGFLIQLDSNEIEIQKINKEAEFDNYSEVKKFLLNNKHLINIVQNVIKKVKILFKDEKLKLEVIHDPEIENCATLTLKILTTKDVDQVLKLMDKLNEWYNTINPELDDKFTIEEEYI